MTGGYTMKEKNIRELAKRMGLITVENMCQYTIAQLVVMIANKVNELIDGVGQFESDVIEVVKTQNEKIQYLLGEGLLLEVENVFNGWIKDGTFDTLINQSALKKVNKRIDETNAQLLQNTNEIATLTGKVNGLSSGSPKGVYPTLESLANAFPQGNLNIYVVLEDGCWYYWSGLSWSKGGVYQSTGIGIESINIHSLNNMLKEGIYNTGSFKWVSGTIDAFSGEDEPRNDRLKTDGYTKSDNYTLTFLKDENNTKTSYNLFLYDLNRKFVSTTGWIKDGEYKLPKGYLFKLTVRIGDDIEITESNKAELLNRLNAYIPRYYMEIEALNDDIENIFQKDLQFDFTWELGSILASTGENTKNETRVRTSSFISMKKGTTIKVNDSYKYNVLYYDEDGSYRETTGWLTDKTTFNEDSVCRLLIAKIDDSSLATSITESVSNISINGGQVYELISKLENYMNEIENKPDDNVDVLSFPKFSFSFNFDTNYVAGHCFVKNELWVFESTPDDEHIGYAYCRRYLVDFENKTGELLGLFKHNWGHVNVVDYCEETDTLIFGNGSGKYTTNIGEIYLVTNTDKLKTLSNDEEAPFNKWVQVINVHSHEDWGYKHNVVWGESNNGKFNICYVITNDNKSVRKVLLGQGDNQLEMGEFVAGKKGLEFNGTYKVLNSYSKSKSIDVLQGCCYYNGMLYTTIGHSHNSIVTMKLNENGTITSTQYLDRLYDDTGKEITNTYLSGIDVEKGHIVVGTNYGLIKLYEI